VTVAHNLRRSVEGSRFTPSDCILRNYRNPVGAGCGRRLPHGYAGTPQPFHLFL